MLQQIFEVCIIPLLGVLTAYIVKLIQKKSNEIDAKIDDDTLRKYNDILASAIKECVLATNQTYVNALKGQNLFDEKAQKEAFKLTYEKVMTIMTDTAKEHLAEAYGDLTIYITTKIEAEVNKNKVESKECKEEKTVEN